MRIKSVAIQQPAIAPQTDKNRGNHRHFHRGRSMPVSIDTRIPCPSRMNEPSPFVPGDGLDARRRP